VGKIGESLTVDGIGKVVITDNGGAIGLCFNFADGPNLSRSSIDEIFGELLFVSDNNNDGGFRIGLSFDVDGLNRFVDDDGGGEMYEEGIDDWNVIVDDLKIYKNHY